MSKPKIIYVLLDGIGDLPHPDLNDLTPLEAALTPNLDKIARKGISGQVISVGEGIAPQSDIAVFNMLGYNFAEKDYVGRGVVECLGCGIDFKDGDLALRGNFATIDPLNKRILDRRAGRVISSYESQEICKLLTNNISIKDIQISIKPTVGHRVIVRFRSNKSESGILGEDITNTDPAYDKIDGIGIAKDLSNDDLFIQSSSASNKESELSSEIVNLFSDKVIEILDKCAINDTRISNGLKPINSILLRDSGNRYPHVKPINEKYGKNFASLVDMPVEIGISKILDMTAYDAGKPDEYELKAQTLLKILPDHDFFYVHIKGPDEFGHDGDAKGKKKNIEDIDKKFFKPLLEGLDDSNSNNDVYFIISGDHSTPCIKKAHSDDPIPFLISGRTIDRDDTVRFTETYCKKGKIGLLYGYQVINKALNFIENKNTSLK